MPVSLYERVRRNHAIEHAAMHYLALNPSHPRLVARSDWSGFTFYGEVDTLALMQATEQGIRALRAGHRQLAIHPRCGSNIAASFLLATAALWITGVTERFNRRRWSPLVPLGAFLGAMLLGRPLGRLAQQQLLTSPIAGDARISAIRHETGGRVPVHRVIIDHG